jgi:uncharacterized protein (TIGR03118 family)
MLKRLASLLSVASLAVAAATAGPASAAPGANAYRVDKLVSDRAGKAANHDPNLVNAWGLAAGPQTPWWVADNGTNRSTLYDGDGNPIPLVVRVGGAPTGTVFNGGSNFVVTHHGDSGPSLFLFATESGTIRGWNPDVPRPAPSTKAFTVVPRSSSGAIYKGLAIASPAGHDRLYATDFHNARVDVFNGRFDRVTRTGAFMDPGIPTGYAPFGIQTFGRHILVTYAKQDADREDDVAGPGHGFVDAFGLNGAFRGRVASRGDLNSPWGLAIAPREFGRFGGDLLVGNFGDGRINAYSESGGSLVHAGMLRDTGGKVIAIDGLWALQFGNGGAAGPTDTLFFTAGPGDESHGLFGRIVSTG